MYDNQNNRSGEQKPNSQTGKPQSKPEKPPTGNPGTRDERGGQKKGKG